MDALPDIDYDAHPAYQPFRGEDPALRRRALEHLEPLVEAKLQTLERDRAVFEHRASGSDNTVVDKLARNGAVGVTLPAPLLGRARDAVKRFDGRLQRRIAALHGHGRELKFSDIEDVLCVNGRWRAGAEEAKAAIDQIIRKTWVIEIAEAYYPDCEASLSGAALRRNVERPASFIGADEPPAPKAASMHIDSSGRPTFNGVIYLSDVGDEQGPFRYVTGSNHWRWDLRDRAIRKAVDDAALDFGVNNRLFLNLPSDLRRKANFGHDLEDGSALSQALLAGERTFTSQDCDMALFDSDGVHRGGQVRRGHRSSILFVLKIMRRR